MRVECFSPITSEWENYTSDSQLNPLECHMWLIKIDQHPALLSSHEHLLSIQELTKAARYVHVADRIRFKLGHIIVRILLSRLLGVPPSGICIVPGKFNKPTLAPGFSTHIDFNISHSANYIAITTSPTPVGVDIEYIWNDIQIDDLIQSVFSGPETSYVLKNQDHKKAFYLLWTRKEALLKAIGTGLVERTDLVPALEGIHQMGPDILGFIEDYKTVSFFHESTYMLSLSYHSAIGKVKLWHY